jgi:hypothetical protein
MRCFKRKALLWRAAVNQVRAGRVVAGWLSVSARAERRDVRDTPASCIATYAGLAMYLLSTSTKPWLGRHCFAEKDERM